MRLGSGSGASADLGRATSAFTTGIGERNVAALLIDCEELPAVLVGMLRERERKG